MTPGTRWMPMREVEVLWRCWAGERASSELDFVAAASIVSAAVAAVVVVEAVAEN